MRENFERIKLQRRDIALTEVKSGRGRGRKLATIEDARTITLKRNCTGIVAEGHWNKEEIVRVALEGSIQW